MKKNDGRREFLSYREIMHELTQPIKGAGLDGETLRRLYESKIVYLENLRTKAFCDLNQRSTPPSFSQNDYQHILKAINLSKAHLKELMVGEIITAMNRRKAS